MSVSCDGVGKKQTCYIKPAPTSVTNCHLFATITPEQFFARMNKIYDLMSKAIFQEDVMKAFELRLSDS